MLALLKVVFVCDSCDREEEHIFLSRSMQRTNWEYKRGDIKLVYDMLMEGWIIPGWVKDFKGLTWCFQCHMKKEISKDK